MAAFIETRAIHRLNLTFLHPHRVSIVPNGCAKAFPPVYEVRHIDAGRHLDDDGTFLSWGTESDHVQAEHGWGDRSDRSTTKRPLVVLIELSHIDALSRLLLRLLHPEDDDAAATVRHGCNVLREVALLQFVLRWELRLPIQIGSLRHTRRNRLIEEFIRQRTRSAPQNAMKGSETHATRIAVITHNEPTQGSCYRDAPRTQIATIGSGRSDPCVLRVGPQSRSTMAQPLTRPNATPPPGTAHTSWTMSSSLPRTG